VLVAVKSEDQAPRSDGRVCKGLWNPTEDSEGLEAKLQVARSEPHSKHWPAREIPLF